MSPAESVDSMKFVTSTPTFPARSDDWSLASKIAMASVSSQGTMGGLIVAGFVRSFFRNNFPTGLYVFID